MKSLGRWLIFPVLLSLLIACGKENESGKAAPIPFPGNGNPYLSGQTPYGAQFQNQMVNVEQVLLQNPCNGVAGAQGRTQHAMEIDPMRFDPPTQLQPGDVYVGVTSFGDVAVITGRGLNQPAQFIGYLCSRSHVPAGQGSLEPTIKVGLSTPRCAFKPITAATITFPGGDRADFRVLEGGTSRRTPFVMPVCL